ncbi:helix-turn-helix transcriptional regulator [Kineosporia mesophila]|uniref:Helix-turn-helix transcriptional regulator n=1 Tax=Kineosporia mesophila TaxID=566012 RepID=A0ABP6ZY27_9ACTN|nr:helix-turn-helix transcriptional regulator [Kineosporia mesophila]MCD5348849.1 helix-turn-helix domain-containing protein [Kineosporia mesophila]
MSAHANPLVSKVELANTLRRLRTGAGRTLEDAAAVLEVSAATISRIETGVRIPRARDVRELCRYYGVQDETRIEELASLVALARRQGWWESYASVDETYGSYIGYEEAAVSVHQFENGAIPAIFQTEAYGQAYYREVVQLYWPDPPDDQFIGEKLKVRRIRRDRLWERERSRHTLILDEAVLRRPVGDSSVMREQLVFLVAAAEEQRVQILLLPTAAGASGGQGPFTILTLPQGELSDLVYLDTLQGQSILEEDEVVARHRRIFAFLRGAALNATESIEVLRAHAGQYS